MRAMLAFAATGALTIAVAAPALWLRHDYRQDKLATLAPPFRSVAVGVQGAGQPARVVFFGDSRIAEWELGAFEPFGPVLNAGFGGDTLAGMAARLDRDVLASEPATVVLLGGINDLTAQSMMSSEPDRRVAFNDSLAQLDDIVARLLARDVQLVLLLVGPPLDPGLQRRLVWGAGIESAVDDLNEHLRALAGPRTRIVDTLDVFAASGDDWAARVRRDPLHYTTEAYALLTAAVTQTLDETR